MAAHDRADVRQHFFFQGEVSCKLIQELLAGSRFSRMTHGHIDFVYTLQIPLEQFNHTGDSLLTASNFLHRINNSFCINGQDRLNIQKCPQNSGGFPNSPAFVNIQVYLLRSKAYAFDVGFLQPQVSLQVLCPQQTFWQLPLP